MKSLALLVLTSIFLASIAAKAAEGAASQSVACRLKTIDQGEPVTRFRVVALTPDQTKGRYTNAIVFERAPWFSQSRRYLARLIDSEFGGNYPRLQALAMGPVQPLDNELLVLETLPQKQLRIHAIGTIRVGDRRSGNVFGKFLDYSFECDDRLPIGG